MLGAKWHAQLKLTIALNWRIPLYCRNILVNMKISLFVALFFTSFLSFGQPSPELHYPERVAAINEQLKTDSLNYTLVWERLQMQVSLLGGSVSSDEMLSWKTDTAIPAAKRRLYYTHLNADFEKIYQHILLPKQYEIAEEGDFYLNRIWFYSHMSEWDKAIRDARYLRDSASYSQYSDRGEYYHMWALFSLFHLHIVTHEYKPALAAIDSMLEFNKRDDPEVFFSGGGGSLGYTDKVSLLEYFGDTNSIVPFLKDCCIDNFNWYFENAIPNDYQSGAAKQRSFEIFQLMIQYMKKYQDKELLKYERIYNNLAEMLDLD